MKKRVLLNWFEMPGRPELLSVFNEIADDIEFIQLFYRTPQDRIEANSSFPMIYWFDYKDPWQLLNEIKPDTVITMNADDLLSISLCVAAKSKGIATFAMQHGFVIEDLERIFMPLVREPISKKGTITKYFKLASFFLKSIKPFSFIKSWEYLNFMKVYFLKGAAMATKNLQYSWRKPDKYICFSNYSSKYFLQRDQISENRIVQIGIPMFDAFFRQLNEKGIETSEKKSSVPYYLLIDTSFGEYKEEVSSEAIWSCYEKLAKYCAERNAILKVKLHPWNYKDVSLQDTSSIRFYRNLVAEELNELIFKAQACFGFYSTLTMPVVCVKKLCQIKYDDIYIKELVAGGVTPVIDFFNHKDEVIELDEFKVNQENLEKFKEKYLYKTDGKAAERLRNALLTH